MRPYSEKLRQSMAAKILSPGGPSALSLSVQTGISHSSLSSWVSDYKSKGRITMSKLERRPSEWTRIERFEAIMNSSNLSIPELGEYLRKNGLTTSHLEKWKKEFISGEESRGVGRPSKSDEEKDLQKEIKVLKRDLHRKDKALAETAALLVLKKKADAIWGTVEDEE